MLVPAERLRVRFRLLAAFLGAVLLGGCGDSAPEAGAHLEQAEPDPPALDLGWAEVLDEAPDPAVVRDPELRRRLSETGLPWRVRHAESGVELLLLPPGELRRGASEGDEEAFDDERPAHTARVTRPFYVGRYEVTQAEWLQVMGTEGGHFTGEPRRPVENVDRFAIEDFLARSGLALPTEAQWEYACRGGDPRARHGELDAIAWYRSNAGMLPHVVGGKAANGWGLHDMLGNVWEWTASPYIQDEYARYAKKGVAAEYVPRRGLGVVLRGGSWYDGSKRLRASARYAVEWPFAAGHVGFRACKLVAAGTR